MLSIFLKPIRQLLIWSCCFMVLGSLASCDYFESEQVKLNKAQTLYQQNKFNQVIIRTKSILQSDSGNCKARMLLGKSQFAKFRLDDAEDSMRKAIENNCQDPSAFLYLVKIYLYRNQPGKASKLFDNPKLSYASRLPKALLLKGDMYFLENDIPSAEKAYSVYYSDTHNDAVKCLSGLKLKLLKKHYQDVVASSEICDKKYSGQSGYNVNESRYLTAIALIREKKINKAVELLHSAVNQPLQPKNPFLKIRPSLLLLHLYLEHNEISKAAELAENVSRYVQTPDVYYAKGRKSEANQRPDLAEKLYLASLKLNPGYRPALLALANIKYEEGNIEQARYYTGRADKAIGSNIFTNALDDRLATRNLRNGKFDAVINSLPQDKSVRSQYLLALAYAGKGEETKAWQVFSKIKRRLNDKVKSDLLEARLDVALGKAYKAEQILKQYVGNGNPEAVSALAQLLVTQHKYDAAESMLSSVLHKYPDNHNAKRLLVELYAMAGRKHKLFTMLDSMIVNDPNNTGFKVYRAKMYYRFAQYQDAINQCDKLIADNQALLQAYIIKANAYTKLSDYQNAEQTYSALLKSGIKDDYAYFMLALLAEKQSRFDDALTYINKSLKVYSHNLRTIYVKLNILEKLGKKGELEKFARTSAQSFQSEKEGHLILGYAFRLLGDDKRAYENYRKVLSAGNADVRTALIVYRLSSKLSGDKAAISELDSYLNSSTGSRDIFVVADYFMKNKEYSLAAKYYEMFVGRDQSNPIVYNNLAWLRMHAGDIGGALKYAKHAASLAPNSPAIMDTLGQVLIENGDYHKAGPYLTRAHSMLKNNPVITYHLAQYYYFAKQFSESRKLLEKVVDVSFPEQQAARNLLKKMTH